MVTRIKPHKKQTPESQVKAALRQEAQYYGVLLYAIVGGPLQRPGLPDYIGVHKGNFLGVECKAGKNQLSTAQEQRKQEIEAAGGTWITYRQPGDLAQALELKYMLW